MTVEKFLELVKEKKIAGTQGMGDFIKKTLEVKTYVPFVEKRAIAEKVVDANTKEVDGVYVNDAINQYVAFVIAMLASHTNLEFSSQPVNDYDLLAQSGLLVPIIETFKEDYNECDIILKMALGMKLENNNINFVVARFLSKIFDNVDDIMGVVKDKLRDVNLMDLLGGKFSEEDLTMLHGFLNKMK